MTSATLRVLGIDPGTRKTGYAVVEGQAAGSLKVLASGVIKLNTAHPLSQRLVVLHQSLVEIIRQNAPGVAAVEDLFQHKNALSALKLGHARGVALLSAALAGIPLYPYAPTKVKQYVTGYGRAEKTQVAEMVRYLTGLDHAMGADESDAIAVAICHLFHHRDCLQDYGVQT